MKQSTRALPAAQDAGKRKRSSNETETAAIKDRRATTAVQRRISAAAAQRSAVVQRQLQETNLEGHYTDSRDAAFPALIFQRVATNLYQEFYSESYYTYLPGTHQFRDANGAYFDPHTRHTFVAYPGQQGTWYAYNGAWYYYDGTYYQPAPQQVQQVQPQPQPQPQIVSTTSVGPSTSNNNASQSAPVVKDNSYFSNLYKSGSSSGSKVAKEEDSLSGSLRSFEEYARQSLQHLEWALDHLASSRTHAQGVKGLPGRIEDAQGFSEQHYGHAVAAYLTFQTFNTLAALWKKEWKKAWLQIWQTCKSLKFDQWPKKDDDDKGGGGKGLGSARLKPRSRLVVNTLK